MNEDLLTPTEAETTYAGYAIVLVPMKQRFTITSVVALDHTEIAAIVQAGNEEGTGLSWDGSSDFIGEPDIPIEIYLEGEDEATDFEDELIWHREEVLKPPFSAD